MIKIYWYVVNTFDGHEFDFIDINAEKWASIYASCYLDGGTDVFVSLRRDDFITLVVF